MTEATTFSLRFRIGLPDREIQELVVESGRALIGSGAHCEVRLPADTAAREHADVVVDGQVAWVRALAKDPAISLGSDPLVEAAWRPSLTLHIGQASLWLEVVQERAPKNRHAPLVALGLVPLFALVAGVLHWTSERGVPEAPSMNAPALFESAAGDCPAPAAESAGAVASDRLRRALAKRERSPFWPRDGVEAVALFETAGACFDRAGEADAQTAKKEAGRLRSKLEEDYRARVVRLEHAYEIQDLAGMRRELPALLSLLEHRSGPYVDWVLALDRYAESETKALRDRGRLPGVHG